MRTGAALLPMIAVAIALVAVGFWLAREGPPPPSPPSDAPTRGFAAQASSGPATIWAVGDAGGGSAAEQRVADLIGAGHPDQLLYLGDVYESGTAAEFARNFAPQLGPFRQITLPTPGNHDWPSHERGYDPYWSAVAGGAVPPDHYSVQIAGWQLISLNSEAPRGVDSKQLRWLGEQVAGGGNCRIAFWHRPRYSAGSHGDQVDIEPIWNRLAGRSSLVINGHEHNMQRLRPIDGITTLISGAGGQSHYGVDAGYEGLAFADTESYGALRLVLSPRRARWTFMDVDGRTLDRGRLRCRAG